MTITKALRGIQLLRARSATPLIISSGIRNHGTLPITALAPMMACFWMGRTVLPRRRVTMHPISGNTGLLPMGEVALHYSAATIPNI